MTDRIKAYRAAKRAELRDKLYQIIGGSAEGLRTGRVREAFAARRPDYSSSYMTAKEKIEASTPIIKEMETLKKEYWVKELDAHIKTLQEETKRLEEESRASRDKYSEDTDRAIENSKRALTAAQGAREEANIRRENLGKIPEDRKRSIGVLPNIDSAVEADVEGSAKYALFKEYKRLTDEVDKNAIERKWQDAGYSSVDLLKDEDAFITGEKQRRKVALLAKGDVTAQGSNVIQSIRREAGKIMNYYRNHSENEGAASRARAELAEITARTGLRLEDMFRKTEEGEIATLHNVILRKSAEEEKKIEDLNKQAVRNLLQGAGSPEFQNIMSGEGKEAVDSLDRIIRDLDGDQEAPEGIPEGIPEGALPTVGPATGAVSGVTSRGPEVGPGFMNIRGRPTPTGRTAKYQAALDVIREFPEHRPSVELRQAIVSDPAFKDYWGKHFAEDADENWVFKEYLRDEKKKRSTRRGSFEEARLRKRGAEADALKPAKIQPTPKRKDAVSAVDTAERTAEDALLPDAN